MLALKFVDFGNVARENKFDLWYNPFTKHWNLVDKTEDNSTLEFSTAQLLNYNLESFCRYLQRKN